MTQLTAKTQIEEESPSAPVSSTSYKASNNRALSTQTSSSRRKQRLVETSSFLSIRCEEDSPEAWAKG